MATIVQILSDGAISGNWILAILASITAFFLIRTLNKFEKRLDSQEKQIWRINTIQLKILTRLGVDNEYFEELSRDVQSHDTE